MGEPTDETEGAGPAASGDAAGTPPHAAAEPHASSAPGAPAPHDDTSSELGAQAPLDNVVELSGKRKRKATAAGPTTPAPPPPQKRDRAQKGDGGVEAGGNPVTPPRKKEKTTDWGTFQKLIELFAYIYPTDTVWDGEKRKMVKIKDLRHMFGASVVNMWLANPKRRTVDLDDIVFDPTGRCGEHCINLFDGLAVEPEPCEDEEVDVMLQLLEHLCSNCRPGDGNAGPHEAMQWVLRWLALPLQQLGGKPRTALVFHGPQGTGKNLFFDCIRGMYGKYGVMVGQTEIDEKYNGWLSAKLMIIANEVVSRQELYHKKNQLKSMISEAESIPIRTMHTDTRHERNHANLVFLSNERQPLALERGDRRYMVVYTPTPEDKDLYARVAAFLAAGGARKFLYFLQHYHLGDFTEHTKPPMTEAKEELIDLSLRAEERFMEEWTRGYLFLPMHVCSVEQLYRAFRRWCDTSGERWPPTQANFTSAAKRWALERVERDEHGNRLDPCLVNKVASYRKGDTTSSPRTSVRCWLPRGTGPTEGMAEGEWVADSIEAFEGPLSRFLRTREGRNDESVTAPA